MILFHMDEDASRLAGVGYVYVYVERGELPLEFIRWEW